MSFGSKLIQKEYISYRKLRGKATKYNLSEIIENLVIYRNKRKRKNRGTPNLERVPESEKWIRGRINGTILDIELQ